MRGKKKRVNYWRARETVGDAAGGFRVTETGYHFLTEAGLVSPSGQTKRSILSLLPLLLVDVEASFLLAIHSMMLDDVRVSSTRIAERSDAARLTGDDRMTAAAVPSS
ncbi:hypothetical protein G5I_05824 [Acromyrmex echinatior]|uniref:Uncharacterized protein n=1 Tax=Acromyrmex echinatior TaxID=103372 RepID=F4WJE5_ACREC|nr:hypothetical protein G5I_05824 [Acromyrmex echinatior]